MSTYRLQTAEGGTTYLLSPGETMIGRGPFLGISDKRVSRNHAVLEVVDDKLRIKPIHVNPCFYQASHKSKFVPLEKNEWHWLHSGDCISLLPDQYSFRVLAEHSSIEATLSNSQALDENCVSNINHKSSTIDNGAKAKVEQPSCSDNYKSTSSVPSEKCAKIKEGSSSDMSSTATCKDDIELSRPDQRKRVLPKWMLQKDLPIQSLPPPVIKAGAKRRHVTVNRTREAGANVTKKQTHIIKSRGDNEDGHTTKEEPAVKLEVFPGTSTNSHTAELGSSHRCVLDNEEEEMEIDDRTPQLSPQIELDSKNSPSGVTTKHTVLSTVDDDLNRNPGSPQTTQQTPKSRTPCIYAERCYRKNPTHFQEYSHPGDSDYHIAESGSQDDDDDRPECPYGTDCYRKNPQHKLEYKHTRPPGRRLRKRTTKKAKSALDDDNDNDGEPNEYDLEDSFIDDDEEEEDFTDEDSDWMPESEEKDSEDMKGLLKEAKRFVKGKH
ncbi:aprataxin and PNK-like factor [Gastrophryne carolinensis]